MLTFSSVRITELALLPAPDRQYDQPTFTSYGLKIPPSIVEELDTLNLLRLIEVTKTSVYLRDFIISKYFNIQHIAKLCQDLTTDDILRIIKKNSFGLNKLFTVIIDSVDAHILESFGVSTAERINCARSKNDKSFVDDSGLYIVRACENHHNFGVWNRGRFPIIVTTMDNLKWFVQLIGYKPVPQRVFMPNWYQKRYKSQATTNSGQNNPILKHIFENKSNFRVALLGVSSVYCSNLRLISNFLQHVTFLSSSPTDHVSVHLENCYMNKVRLQHRKHTLAAALYPKSTAPYIIQFHLNGLRFSPSVQKLSVTWSLDHRDLGGIPHFCFGEVTGESIKDTTIVNLNGYGVSFSSGSISVFLRAPNDITYARKLVTKNGQRW